jgi:hypothetical protein
MYFDFKEEFDLPISEIFPYFETPSDWAKLYGVVKPSKILSDNWHSIPLKAVPFPLLAKNVVSENQKRVRWIFGGFWRGVGEVNFSTENGKTVISGFECITPHGTWLLSSMVEKHFMEKEFIRIWNLGWKRIRKNEGKD